MGKFVHLQVKSHFSISSGLPRTNQIVDKAVENNMGSVALTDKNSFFNALASNCLLSINLLSFVQNYKFYMKTIILLR